jgi:hypothetical protein
MLQMPCQFHGSPAKFCEDYKRSKLQTREFSVTYDELKPLSLKGSLEKGHIPGLKTVSIILCTINYAYFAVLVTDDKL